MNFRATWQAWMLVLAMLLAVAPAKANSAGAPTLLASALPLALGEETLLGIAINGHEVSSGLLVLRERGGAYAVALDDANAWRLVLPVQARETRQGHVYVALRLVPAIRVVFNDALQRLELTVPVRFFEKTLIDQSALAANAPVRHHGAFLDYDVRGQTLSGQPAIMSGVFDADVTLGHGVTDVSFLGDMGEGVGGMRRVSTSWQEDDVDRRASLRLGDASRNSGALISGSPFLGVQYLSNFSTVPGMTLTARPSVAGALDSPGTADVYVDGRLVLQQQLPTGPFQIDNIPVAGDVGNVQVLVKDASGKQQQVLAAPFFGSPSLLRAGITEFSWGAGVQGTQESTGATLYGKPIAEAFDQRGFTDRFTGELDTQIVRGGSALSAGGIWLLPRVGTFDLALSAGSGTSVGGSRFDYEYISRKLRFGFELSSLQQNLQNTPLLVSSGVQALPSATRASQGHLSMPISLRSSLSLSVNNQNAGPSASTRTLDASYSALFGRTQFNLSLFKTSGSITTNAITLNLLIPLDSRRRLTSTATTQSGASSQSVTLAADPLLDGAHDRLGYTLIYGGAQDASAQVASSSSIMDASAGYSRIGGTDEAQFDTRGSLALLDGRVYPSRNIQQSYGLAEVPGYPNVRVYANNQFAGTTNARGDVLLPNLQSYAKNVITLETKDFPITANVDVFSKTVVPYYRSPVSLRFPVRGAGGAIVHVKTAGGAYVPAGATLASDDGLTWPVADEGEAYLEGVLPGPLRLSVRGTEKPCSFTLLVPKDVADIPDLGEVICR